MAGFKAPPAEYRSAPFFVLNDDHEGAAGEARITKMLEDYQRLGFGGAFLHPRPGLITEYLSPRWFELIRHSIRECRRLGLVPYFYDENSYPSGVGGGHVPSRVPEARTRFVTPILGDQPGQVPPASLALYRWDGRQPSATVARSDIQPGEPWIAFVMENMAPLPWHGETACPSLLDPRTAEAFLNTTHEAYRRETDDLWTDVPAIFTDEPHLPADGHGPWGRGLHLTPSVLGEFQQRRGYDLRPQLPSIFFDVGDYRAIRFDLYDLMHQLWMENWALPLERWCDEHDIALTGHYLEHDWPCPYATPGHVHLLAHMHWPGTDMLETFLLAGHEDHDIQNFAPAPDGQEPHGLVYLRQVHSVANQLGKKRVLDECWGAGGHDSTPADWARIGRWLIVHGVNLLNPHLSLLTIRGTRKTDHPQTFSDHSPWFEHIGPFNDELSRLCWASNQGTIEQRILLLDPLTTGFCQSRKADCLPSSFSESSRHTAAAPPTGEGFLRPLASVQNIQQEFGDLAQGLSDAQVDFDIGDEYVMEEFGQIAGSTLALGAQTYQLLLWPGCMTNLRAATATMLEEYLEHGGQLFGVRPERVTVNGRPSPFLQTLDERFAKTCRWFAGNNEVVTAVQQHVTPRLQVEQPPATGLAHMRRVLPNGELFVVVNSSAKPIDSPIRVETARSHLYHLDPSTGKIHPLPVSQSSGGLASHLHLNPRAATVLLATDEQLGGEEPARIAPIVSSGTPLHLVSISPGAPNVLVIDSCELSINGEVGEREAVYAANRRLWQAHGFETNGWSAVIQYRDQVVARNRSMAPESGGTATYRVEIAEGVDPSSIHLAVETPELWRIAVNGQVVDSANGERWLDEHIRAIPVGHLLHAGPNAITLAGRPFDVRREIDQIYLLGDFTARPTNPGYRIDAPQSLALGPWRDQGYPFYDRDIAYTFELPSGQPGTLTLNADDWVGSILVIEQEGKIVARLWEPPYQIPLDPAQGRQVTLRVVGLPKNLLGPFHAPGKPRRRAWPAMWLGPDVPTEPQPGEAYDLLDLGLFHAPRWVPDEA
jgi:hypothetical protein